MSSLNSEHWQLIHRFSPDFPSLKSSQHIDLTISLSATHQALRRVRFTTSDLHRSHPFLADLQVTTLPSFSLAGTAAAHTHTCPYSIRAPSPRIQFIFKCAKQSPPQQHVSYERHLQLFCYWPFTPLSLLCIHFLSRAYTIEFTITFQLNSSIHC